MSGGWEAGDDGSGQAVGGLDGGALVLLTGAAAGRPSAAHPTGRAAGAGTIAFSHAVVVDQQRPGFEPDVKVDGSRGARLARVWRRLRVSRAYKIGLNTWYLVPNGPSRGVLKVRHGVILEIGIADKQLTAGAPRAILRFLKAFR